MTNGTKVEIDTVRQDDFPGVDAKLLDNLVQIGLHSAVGLDTMIHAAAACTAYRVRKDGKGTAGDRVTLFATAVSRNMLEMVPPKGSA